MKLKKNLKLDFVSSAILDKKTKKKRINFILNKVKDGSILVTDGVFNSDEEMDLIKETMRKVDEGFPGIEVCGLKKTVKGFGSLAERFTDQKEKLQKFFSGLRGNKEEKTSLRTGLTLIGPAKVVKEIKKNPESFSVLTEV
jgi:hypothetical protein